MIWLILGAALLTWLLFKWTMLALWYMAVGIGMLGIAMFRLVTNRWPV